MYIDRLLLANFKNYIYLDVSFSNNVNCLVGNNGVGKTNLLDALYYLSFCKSYFNPVDSQNIRMGADYFAINGQYVLDDEGGDPVTVACTLQRGQSKKMKFNKKKKHQMNNNYYQLLFLKNLNQQNIVVNLINYMKKILDLN